MNKKITSLLLLIILSITDAFLLAHPNLIGRVGIWIYKYTYIRNFPRALLTVGLVVGISLAVCELIYRFLNRRNAIISYIILELIAVAWLIYVYQTFATFSYSITGKAFIYGVHLLPVLLIGVFSRYLFKRILDNPPANATLIESTL